MASANVHYDSELHHVFISYAHEDKDIMRRVFKNLVDADLKVWVDEMIEDGGSWEDIIEKNLSNSFSLILILSGNSVHSEHVWNEFNQARDLKIRIFTLVYDLEGEILSRYRRLNYRDLRPYTDLTSQAIQLEEFAKTIHTYFYPESIYDVYIIHAREDREERKHIRNNLKDKGLYVWQYGNRRGDEYTQEMRQALVASRRLVFLLSTVSANSNWVKRDLLLGDLLEKPIFVLNISSELLDYDYDNVYISASDIMQLQNVPDNDRAVVLQRFGQAVSASLMEESEEVDEVSSIDETDEEQEVDATQGTPLPPIMDDIKTHSLVRVMETIASLLDSHARACIFRVDFAQDELYIVAATQYFSDVELRFRFKKLQGIVGQAWSQETGLIINPRTYTFEDEFEDEIASTNYSNEMSQFVQDTQFIVVLPIKIHGDIWTILSLDHSDNILDRDISSDDFVDINELINNILGLAQVATEILIEKQYDNYTYQLSYYTYLGLSDVLNLARLLPIFSTSDNRFQYYDESPSIRSALYYKLKDSQDLYIIASSRGYKENDGEKIIIEENLYQVVTSNMPVSKAQENGLSFLAVPVSAFVDDSTVDAVLTISVYAPTFNGRLNHRSIIADAMRLARLAGKLLSSEMSQNNLTS